MIVKNILVVGGYNDEEGTFHAQRSMVVPSNKLGLFFSRYPDFQTQKSPVIKMSETPQKHNLYWC